MPTTKECRFLRSYFVLFAACSFIFFWGTILLIPQMAEAGRASSGELLWFPCDRCHPLGTKPIPQDFEGHRIILNGHDRLGPARTACLSCHQPGTANPGLLKLADGGLTPIDGNVSEVCYRCHSAKFKEWRAGTHGKSPRCTTAGCHDPHTPGWIAISPLLPYLGTTLEVRVTPERVAFKALPLPPDPPRTPSLPILQITSVVGLLAIAALLLGPTFLARLKR